MQLQLRIFDDFNAFKWKFSFALFVYRFSRLKNFSRLRSSSFTVLSLIHWRGKNLWGEALEMFCANGKCELHAEDEKIVIASEDNVLIFFIANLK
jgi:hypothetical protein